ncbi:hypothetical protein F-VV57_0141 [Faustovirus]|nr:hypothetical protein F-VV57_0141 [Faustovirus]QJX73408.1 hypothetical protein F-VV63_0142 [Faustovirus]
MTNVNTTTFATATYAYEGFGISVSIEYFAAGAQVPHVNYIYNVVRPSVFTGELIVEYGGKDVVMGTEMDKKSILVNVKDVSRADYAILLRFLNISGTGRIVIADFVQKKFREFMKKPLFECAYLKYDSSFMVNVLDEGANYHNTKSAIMRVKQGRVCAREDKLANSDVRGITFKHSDGVSNNIYVCTDQLTMGYAAAFLETMQAWYDEIVAQFPNLVRYGVHDHIRRSSDVEKFNAETNDDVETVTRCIETLAVNKPHPIDTTFEIIDGDDLRPVIKFNRSVDISEFRFRFAINNAKSIYVNLDGDAIEEPVYGVTYKMNDNAIESVELLFPPGTRAQALTFYTNTHIINSNLIAIEKR